MNGIRMVWECVSVVVVLCHSMCVVQINKIVIIASNNKNDNIINRTIIEIIIIII